LRTNPSAKRRIKEVDNASYAPSGEYKQFANNIGHFFLIDFLRGKSTTISAIFPLFGGRKSK
jgi:hypothetical protein